MRRLIPVLAFVLALGAPLWGEVAFKSLSVSQTVAAHTFAAGTHTVVVISDGANTCYYRLFNNRDTSAAATTDSIPIKSGEAKTYEIKKYSTEVGSGSQGAATAWTSISAICDTGETATFRIESF